MSARSLRARTDIRFAILIAAVLASSVVALSVIHVASPPLERLHRERVNPCLDGMDAAVAPLQLPAADSIRLYSGLAGQCMEPFFSQQATWVGLGLLTQLILAALLYGSHPWWLARRRRLTRLTGAGNADVLAELDGLARQAGLARPPQWLLDPYASTHGGQAFGLPRRRRVCLDVGLLLRFDTDRDGFRAVIRHELGHLHNRDVDRTYFTIAIWWSFVVMLVAPFVALSLNPDVLRRPLVWSWPGEAVSPGELLYRLVALLFLTVVVYLTRNAILRAREVHADVVAAGWDAPDGALARVVEALPWPPRAGRWPGQRRWRHYAAQLGTHPDPRYRVAAMSDPGRLVRTGGWDLAGLGLVTGLALNNVSIFVGNHLGAYLMIGLVLVALPVGMLLVGVLVSAVHHQVDAVRSGQRPSRRETVLLPVAGALGFAAAGPLSLLAADTGMAGLDTGPVAFAMNTALLVTGALMISAWTRSVDRSLLEQPGTERHRCVSGSVVTATAVAVGAPLFALWYYLGFGGLFTTVDSGDWPLTGWAIEWYSTLAETIGGLFAYQPFLLSWNTPVASLGMLLLWAVPAVLLGWRQRPSRLAGFRRAATIGAVAGMTAVLIGIALPYAARAALPVEVRRIPDDLADELGIRSFAGVYSYTYMIMAALLQAAAAAVVAATTTRLRPVLVPLAVTTTAVLATAGYYTSWAVSNCINLVERSTPTSCSPKLLLPDGHIDTNLHAILVWGAIVAVPAALLSAGAAALWRRRGPALPAVPAAGHCPRRWPTVSVLGTLGALVIVGAAMAVPGNIRFWTPDPAPNTTIPLPAAGGVPRTRTIDPCLIGTWREASHRTDTSIGVSTAHFTSSGATQTFTRDGVVTLDYGTGVTDTATVDGHLVEFVITGSITARYHTDNGIIRYDDEKVTHAGTVTTKVNGSTREREPLAADLSDDRYACTSDTLWQISAETGSQYAIELDRR
ncbi:M48 family metalloprotease [Micromonospora matsumotoense]|uniref:M48 family metalloprotease n=1 Tax=Micromonospora matsumotoense TaxID=121616 RepID=UPI003D8A696F